MTGAEIDAVLYALKEDMTSGVYINLEGDVIDGSLDSAIQVIIDAAKRAGVVK